MLASQSVQASSSLTRFGITEVLQLMDVCSQSCLASTTLEKCSTKILFSSECRICSITLNVLSFLVLGLCTGLILA